MTVREMRCYILDRYPNWSKVHWMSDNQIIAVYHSLIDREERKALQSNKELEGYQFTIYDYI